MAVDPPRPRAHDHIDTDDLFGKLDQLINRHQGRAAGRATGAAVPTLTETVDATAPAPETQIPVLSDVVDLPPLSSEDLPWAGSDKRRQLQVALYLRLRQRLDQELGGEAFAFVPPGQLTQLAQALRNALPAVIRESVEQVLGGGDQD